MLTFLEIQSKVDQICEKIGLEKKRVWPAVQNDGTPYVLIHEDKYWYISAALLHKGLKDKAPLEDPNLSYNSGLRSA